MIYIATPYSSPDAAVRQERFEQVTEYAAKLKAARITCFSPITYGHPIALQYALPTDAEFWEDFNYRLFCACTSMHLLQLPGWETSKGVAMELSWAKRLQMPVEMIKWPNKGDN